MSWEDDMFDGNLFVNGRKVVDWVRDSETGRVDLLLSDEWEDGE